MARMVQIANAGIGDTLGENSFGLGELVLLAVGGPHVQIDKAHEIVEPRFSRQRDASVQMRKTAFIASHQYRRTDDHLRRRDRCIVIEPPG